MWLGIEQITYDNKCKSLILSESLYLIKQVCKYYFTRRL